MQKDKNPRVNYVTFLAILLVMVLIVTVAVSARNIDSNERGIAANEDSLIAAEVRLTTLEAMSSLRGQRMLELEDRIEILKERMNRLEGRGVFWMIRTGKEVVILTADGQELRCYFPDDKEE